jgi:hypothetical protein
MELTGEKGIWLMFYNFKGLFAYFQISEKYLINFKILMKYLTFHSFFNNNSKGLFGSGVLEGRGGEVR